MTNDKPYSDYTADDCWRKAITVLDTVRDAREKFAELEEEQPFRAHQVVTQVTTSISVSLAEAQVWATLSQSAGPLLDPWEREP